MAEETRVGKSIRDAFDSLTFDQDISIHVDSHHGDCGSATISPSGRDVAIASRFGLDIIDLDFPLNPPRRLRHGQSWNVVDVQWSPFAARDYWVASTSNQKAIVWNLSMSEDGGRSAIEHTLHAHTRAITDINFSAHHPDILSTCAVDGYVHCWDLRKPRRPVMTFVDWDAGATQVKWNRQDGHILASAHDRWLRIWDERKGAYPLRSIEAHSSKIYGVDWNRTRATEVVTCSLDKSIKFWDYTNDGDIPERVIRTDFPVWRARHTPFGWGLLAMPQDVPGRLHLYDRRKDDASPDASVPEVKVFSGHGDCQVKEFLWRSRGGVTTEGIDEREFQLVSWGEDHELRLRRMDPQTLAGVGYIKGSQIRKKLNVTRKGAVYKTFRNVDNPEADKTKAAIRGPRHSILSDKLQSAYSRGHLGSKSGTMRGKPMAPASRNQIGWMSGIKFNKKPDAAPGAKKPPPERRLSVMSPGFDSEWNPPETLHDEIIHISSLFTKVNWDSIEMDKRRLRLSMNGPWGDGGESIYVSVAIEFPDRYPEAEVPRIAVGKTSLLKQEINDRISQDLRQIADTFVQRKHGCLRAIVCYLLGELDLEQSTLLFADSEDDDDENGIADESSSEDDESDVPATAVSQELGSSTTEATGMLIDLRGNANMPPPRFCGATFSSNGKLVCFFPPKEDKVKSLLGTVDASSRTKGPLFNTFANLRKGLIPRSKLISVKDEDDGDSDSSGDSDDSSSSSETDSSRFRAGLNYGFWRKSQSSNIRNGLSTNRSQRSSGAGTTTGTGTGTAGSRSRFTKPKNMVSVHDVSEFIPSKKELADEYAIFGNGPDVCNHNSDVARRHGQQDLADIWKYAAMLLEHEVPLEVLNRSHHREPILIIAHDIVRRCRSNSDTDSGVDLSHDTHKSDETQSKADMAGRVKWGCSPLAGPLISGLFDHFESLGDVQMLAMLACVFSEPSAENGVSKAEMHLSQPQTPLSMKTPAFSLDYFHSDAAAWGTVRRFPYSGTTTPRTVVTPSGIYGSVGSSNGGPWESDPASASYSCGDTPPIRSGRGSAEKLMPQHTHSPAISPDEPRNPRRSNTGMSSFAANITRSFSAAISSSPPNKKRPSPVESLINSLAPQGITWGNNTFFDSAPTPPGGSRVNTPGGEVQNWHGDISSATGISVTMFNQDEFDDDGCMSVPLLQHKKARPYSSYRRAYAEMLCMWEMPLARLEILKFDTMPDYFKEAMDNMPKSLTQSQISNEEKGSLRDGQPPSPIVLGKNQHLNLSMLPDTKGLDITGYCLRHENRLEPLSASAAAHAGGAVGRCDRCRVVQTQLQCIICIEPLSAVFTPCLSCGCASHPECLSQWHQAGETSCAGGCNCDCRALAGNGMVESYEVMMDVIEKMRRLHAGQQPRHSEESDRDDGTDWESVRTERTDSQSRPPPSPGLPLGYTALSRQLRNVRTAEWGTSVGLRSKRNKDQER